MTAIILTIAGLLLGVLLVFIAVVWLFQEHIAFQPPRPPATEAIETNRVAYQAADGQPLFAYLVGEPRKAKGVLLSFHGNADLAVHAIDWAQEVNRTTGFAVMLTEYRGYMNLGGRPSYLASQLDAEAAYVFARDKLNFPPDRIALYGHSLGSGIATELASRHRPAVLLLESPFTSRSCGTQLLDSTLTRSGKSHHSTRPSGSHMEFAIASFPFKWGGRCLQQPRKKASCCSCQTLHTTTLDWQAAPITGTGWNRR